jgi:hypothetical protein
MLLIEVIGKNLPGWELVIGYVMAAPGKLLGWAPALLSGTEKLVVCLNRDDLKKISDTLPCCKVSIVELPFYINRAENIALIVEGKDFATSDSKTFFLVNGDKLDEILQTEQPFCWDPGIPILQEETQAIFT